MLFVVYSNSQSLPVLFHRNTFLFAFQSHNHSQACVLGLQRPKQESSLSHDSDLSFRMRTVGFSQGWAIASSLICFRVTAL